MEYKEFLEEFVLSIKKLNQEDKISAINEAKIKLHEISPFKNEPVDCVIWEKAENIMSNDYNPNKVAPPEMELLKISIANDGYTQPVVTFKEKEKYTVIDGFHRTRVSKECKEIQERIFGYTPITIIRKSQEDRKDRIASTIRHNRARGKHTVDAMSEIVLELKNRNWKNSRIARELGMDEEEILRLCQISGLEDIFKDDDFSKSWNIEDSEDDFVPLTDEVTEQEKEENKYRTTNTSDPDRIFHTFDKWECAKAGFYLTNVDGKKKDDCEREYAELLSNDVEFEKALERVIYEWKHSCEHYLTNKSMNRVAWLGQASLCIARGIPSSFRGGWNLLSIDQQEKANLLALKYLNKWLVNNNLKEVSLKDGLSEGRQVEIY